MSFSLYVHFPFCTNRCSYCDFYKELYDPSLERRFFDALKIETKLAAAQYGDRIGEIATIFIGGGTPSLVNLDLFADWLNHLKSLFPVSDKIEFSVESNPESITLDNLEAFKNLGVNRPVFGVQSFDTKLLKLLDRRHIPHHSHRAIYFANALGFRNFGIDIIFGLPFQTGRRLADDIDQVMDLRPPHISFYQLTVEEGTPLAERVRSGKVRLPNQELSLAMYRSTCERLAAAGYRRYEVSSFAQPGFECRHNIGYWEGTDYLGLGPSAHSFIDNQRFLNKADLNEYITMLEHGARPVTVDESGIEERMVEAIMLGLRTSRGVSRSQFSRRFGVPLEDKLDKTQYEMLIKSGHIEPDESSLKLTDEGVYLADEITRRLIK